jgi:glycerophosphoryl diester phosphodiesterase
MSVQILSVLLLSATLLQAQPALDKQGHRGCRGWMPENTIPAMKKAMDLGVTTLEMDVVISKDKKVVVSHDTYMSSVFCLKPNGDSISRKEEKSILLYGLNYSEIKQYDAGSKHNAGFPQQQNFPAYKPLLSELIDSVKFYAQLKKTAVPLMNIEIKSQPEKDGIEHPDPQVFVDLVIDVLKQKNILQNINIQSFDIRPLQILHQQYPKVVLSYLVGNTKSLDENLALLGFVPNIYSPHYKLVNADLVKACHEKGMKILPWTANSKEEINALIALGVDGIITDYPNLF